MSDFNKMVALCEAGALLHANGWTPATSGNCSARRDETSMWVTATGVSIGSLAMDDILIAGLDGVAVEPARRASAESALHGHLYRLKPKVGAVLHTHAPNATVASMLFGDSVDLAGFELVKAFEGITSHEVTLRVPIVDNHQDMAVLCERVEQVIATVDPCWGVLIRGHGLYAWGSTLNDTLRHLEAFEFLFGCAVAIRGSR